MLFVLILIALAAAFHPTRALTTSSLIWRYSTNPSIDHTFLFSSSVDREGFGIEEKYKTFQDYESNSFASSLQALRAYYKIHGDLVIPRSYEVPDSKGRCTCMVFILCCDVMCERYIDLNQKLACTPL